ncbi:MAG: FdhF/YdeP family oxidoreductase [Deltaproteobacteria bacterium]
MDEREKLKPSPQTPQESGKPRIGARAKSAAGGFAIVSAIKRAYSEMGVSRGVRTLLRVNQRGGFDCQSCAWPNPEEERHTAEFCENGAKAVADEATLKRVNPDFFRNWTVSRLAEQSDFWLNAQGRLAHPMILREGSRRYEPLCWEEAFEIIAEELKCLSSPDEALFYTSGRTSNEAAFLYQLFAREFGTNNLPDCSNMCHESSGRALGEVIGVGKGTVSLRDFELAEAIFVVGQNPGTNHPRMLASLEKAKRGGAKIVAVNPLPEAGLMRFKNPQEILRGIIGGGTELADLFLQVRIGGDIALFKGIMKQMLQRETLRPGSVLDSGFISEFTAGFEGFRDSTERAGWDEILRESGVSREAIGKAAQIAAQSRATIVCWAMGITQHKHAVATIQEIVNFLLLRGQIGKPGAGVCPVRGHSNVQGDRTMGICERPTEAFLDALAREFGFTPPRRHGFDTVQAIEAMHSGRAKVFIAMGGNFLSATPDTRYTARALGKCSLTVQISTKLSRSHLITGRRALILPCLGRSEQDTQASGGQFVTVEDSMSIISSSQGFLPPASEHLMSELAIVAGIARATLGGRSRVNWQGFAGNYDRIRDSIERVIPGFEGFNKRIREGSFYLPNRAGERKFDTPTQRATFTTHPIPRAGVESGRYAMMTIRSHDQFNTTVYGLDDRYRGVYGGRRVIFLNAEDMRDEGIAEGQFVDITSHFEGEERGAEKFAAVPYDIPRGCAATYFPEANPLVPIRSTAEISNTPTSKFIVISLKPSEQ